MHTGTRKRYNLMCSDSPESLVLEMKPDHDTVYITLSTGTVTITPTVAVLKDLYDLIYKWLKEPSWMFDSKSEQTLESKTIVHNGTPTVFVSISCPSKDETSVSITSQGVTTTMVFSDLTYPHYNRYRNLSTFMNHFIIALTRIETICFK